MIPLPDDDFVVQALSLSCKLTGMNSGQSGNWKGEGTVSPSEQVMIECCVSPFFGKRSDKLSLYQTDHDCAQAGS